MDKKQKADEKARELEKTQQSLSALNGLAGAVGELFGQSKELAFAQALINGALAVTSILAQYPKFDGGFAMTAAIAAAVISTTASLKKISETKAPKKAKFFYGGYEGTKKNGVYQRLKATDVLSKALDKSNVLDTLADNLADLRAEAVVTAINFIHPQNGR